MSFPGPCIVVSDRFYWYVIFPWSMHGGCFTVMSWLCWTLIAITLCNNTNWSCQTMSCLCFIVYSFSTVSVLLTYLYSIQYRYSLSFDSPVGIRLAVCQLFDVWNVIVVLSEKFWNLEVLNYQWLLLLSRLYTKIQRWHWKSHPKSKASFTRDFAVCSIEWCFVWGVRNIRSCEIIYHVDRGCYGIW